MDRQSRSGTPPTLIPRIRKVPEQGTNHNSHRMSFDFSSYFPPGSREAPTAPSGITTHLCKPQLLSLAWDGDPGWNGLGATWSTENVPVHGMGRALDGIGGPFPPKPVWDSRKGCVRGAPERPFQRKCWKRRLRKFRDEGNNGLEIAGRASPSSSTQL